MHVSLIAAGRWKEGPEKALFDEYARRSPWPLVLREIEVRKRLAGPALKQAEAELLLAAVPAGAKLIALDERGRECDSPAFADRLGRWRDDGVGAVALVIGGADGLDESVRARADWVLALGRLTWPHLLVRALVAEQLYRAQTILSGHPYHRS